ncbi:MAG: redoxin domain-containing protein [Sphingobacteriales bacterium]|nr:redoxin domain-containing protein [Sphingobacteriales bacterium]
MKRFSISILAFLLLSFVVPAFYSPLPSLSIGDKAPEIDLPNMDGKSLKLSSLQGNLVLLSFWSTWCAACNTIKNPEYVRLHQEFKDAAFGTPKTGFKILSVAFDSNKETWLKRIFDAGLLWDSHVIDLDSYYSSFWYIYNLRSIPSSFLLDEKGKIIGINMDYSTLKRELEKRKTGALAPPANSDTAPPKPDSETPKPPTPPPKPDSETPKPPTPPTKPDSETPKPPTPPTKPDSETPKPPTPPTNTTPTAAEVFKIQLGVLRSPDLSAYKALNDLGVVEFEKVSSGTLLRVLLGAFNKETDAANTLKTAKARGFKDAFLVKRPGKTAKPNKDTGTTTPTKPNSGTTTTPSSPSSKPPAKTIPVFKIQLGKFAKADISKFKAVSHIGALSVEKAEDNTERVLLGSFADRIKADLALAKVKDNGFSGFIVQRQEAVSDLEMLSLKDPLPPLQRSMIGEKAPDMNLKNAQGVAVPLSSQRGKTVLLYLWATWSAEARDNIADLNEFYQKYKGDDFELYSVAFDRQTRQWQKVSEEDQVGWNLNLVDPEGTRSDLLRDYGVRYLPALFIIDENGVVVKENLQYDDLNTELQKRLKK